jgi:ABC-type multidrug transport system fused ATPase/permease subunit
VTIPVKQYLDLLLNYLEAQRVRVVGLALLLLGTVGLQLLSPQVIRYFIDAAQAGAAQQALMMAALLFVAIVLAQRVLAIATTYTSENIAWTATNRLRTDLTRHVLNLDIAFHNIHTPGELLERIDGDVDRLAHFFSQFVLQILSGLLLLLGVLTLLFLEDWRIGLALTLFALIYLAVHAWDQQLATPHWRLERQLTAELLGFVGDRLAGLKDIHTSGAGAYVMQRFYGLLRQVVWYRTKADVVTDVGWTISKLVYALGFAAAMALSAYLFGLNLITLGSVYLVIHYLEMVRRPLDRIGGELEELQQARVSIERVKSLTETQAKITSGPALLPAEGAVSVSFETISFGYGPEQQVLHDISFRLEPGQVLGLLGRTGSGKTSLSRLLFRFYESSAGVIRLNEVDLRRLDLAHLRQRVGLVTQEVQLFQASLRDNLTLFDRTIPDERILESFEALGLSTWYQALPQGLDTELMGDSSLSAGEAQLLALTRIFLKDPGLVILDEASSRLDPATEQLLERAMDRLLQDRTGIIIAHRLSTVRRADQIMILEEGRIKEYGTYQALANRPGSLFSRLLQTGLQEAPA